MGAVKSTKGQQYESLYCNCTTVERNLSATPWWKKVTHNKH